MLPLKGPLRLKARESLPWRNVDQRCSILRYEGKAKGKRLSHQVLVGRPQAVTSAHNSQSSFTPVQVGELNKRPATSRLVLINQPAISHGTKGQERTEQDAEKGLDFGSVEPSSCCS